MPKYEIDFMRHGQTYFNKYNKMQSWSDTPLTPDGVETAVKVANKIKNEKYTKIFTTNTSRAVETGKIIVRKNQYLDHLEEPIPQFRQQFFGYFEGNNSTQVWTFVGNPHGCNTMEEIIDKGGFDATMDWMKEADPYHDAENSEEYWNRINNGFEHLDSVANDGDKFLFINHGMSIMSLADKFGDGSFNVTTTPDNSTMTKLTRNTDDNSNIVTEYAKNLSN